jgi:hypothetical protein
MGNRINNAADQQIANIIATAAKQTQDLKNAQPIGGDSLTFYQSDSGNTYDWSGTLPASPVDPTSGQKILVVGATAINQNVLFADFIYELYVGASTTPYTFQDYLNDISSSHTGFVVNAIIPQPLNINQQNKAAIGLSLIGDKTTTCHMKFYIVANDQVTISVTEKN